MIYFKMCLLLEDKWGVFNICRFSFIIICLVVWVLVCDIVSIFVIDWLLEYWNVFKYIEGCNFEIIS